MIFLRVCLKFFGGLTTRGPQELGGPGSLNRLNPRFSYATVVTVHCDSFRVTFAHLPSLSGHQEVPDFFFNYATSVRVVLDVNYKILVSAKRIGGTLGDEVADV